MRKILILALLGSSLLPGQVLEDLFWAKLAARIESLDKNLDGVLGVALIDLRTGRRMSYQGDVQFTQASLIKVPVLVEVFRRKEAGQLRFDEKVRLTQKDMVGGSGVMQHRLKNGPVETTVEELVREMIASSDNLATNWVIERVGMARVNQTMAQLGFRQTRLQRVMLDQAAASRGDENISTPNEMATMMERIYRGQLISPQACAGMLEMLKLVKAALRKSAPEGIVVAAKPGSVDGVRTEAGIVYLRNRPYVLSVMSAYLKEPPGEAGASPVADVAALVFDYMQKLDKANQYGNLGVH
jgi:beta-lactamase class A